LALAGAAALPATRPARAAVADLDFASALDAAWAIRAGQVSSVELTSRMLERIARHNPPLNAIVMLAADAALARARVADEARARRESWGPFHGVPITIKDTFEVAGVTTTASSTSLRNHVPPRDAAVVARLKGAGAIVSARPTCRSSPPTGRATTRCTAGPNPWDVARTPAAPPAAGRPRWRWAHLSRPGSDLANRSASGPLLRHLRP
jgi:amidase